jgi:hypothetical protein
MATYVAKQRSGASYVSVTDAPSFVLRNIFAVSEAETTRAMRRVSFDKYPQTDDVALFN